MIVVLQQQQKHIRDVILTFLLCIQVILWTRSKCYYGHILLCVCAYVSFFLKYEYIIAIIYVLDHM